MRLWIAAGSAAVILITSGCSRQSEEAPGTAGVPPAPPPRHFTLAAGWKLSVRTTTTLSTKTNKAGETFLATLHEPITDGDWVIAEKGAAVEGVIARSDPGGRVKGRAQMGVAIRSLTLADGSKIDLSTSSFTVVAKATKRKDAAKIGIGGAIGAAIGAIAGGGRGAAIGAGAGGGAGTAVVLATRGDPAVLPSESVFAVSLRAPVEIVERK